MKLFFTTLRLELKRILRGGGFWILLSMLVACLGVSTLLLSGDSGLIRARVGIVFQEDDPQAKAIFDALPENELVEFVPLHDPDDGQLRDQVASGRLECAYLLDSGLRERLLDGEISFSVPKLTSPATVLDTLTDQWLYAAVLEQFSPQIAADDLSKRLGLPYNEVLAEIELSFVNYDSGHNFVEVAAEWGGGSGSDSSAVSTTPVRVTHGLIALLLLLFASARLGTLLEEKSRLRPGLTLSRELCFWLGAFAAQLASSFAMGCGGLLLLRIFFPAALGTIGLELAALFLYCALLAALTLLLGVLLRGGDALLAGTVFLTICCLALGGVLFDPAEISRWLHSLSRLLPTSGYGDAAVYASLSPLGGSAFAAVLCLGAAALAVVLQRKWYGFAFRRKALKGGS